MGKSRAEMRRSERIPAALLRGCRLMLLLRDVTVLQRRIGCERSVSLFHMYLLKFHSLLS